MGLNYQDVIRDVHDPSTHALKISGTIQTAGQATVNINGSATLYAVVNTSAAGDSVNNIGFATVSVSNPTLYAVVNTGAAGDPKTYIGLVTATLDNSRGVGVVGNLTITDSKGFIGLTTSVIGNSVSQPIAVQPPAVGYLVTSQLGNVTLSDAKTYIGLTTTTIGNNSVQAFGQFFPVLQSIASGGLGPVSLDNFGRQQVKITADSNIYIGLTTTTLAAVNTNSFLGLVTVAPHGLLGNLTLSDAKTNIGLVTLTGGTAWTDPKTYIGLVTVGHTVTVGAHGITGNITITDSKGYIGLVTVTQASSARTITGNLTLSDAKTYIGLNTVTTGVGDRFIGLVTAWTRNAGSAKTLTPYALTLSTSSVVTIAVPTNNQAMYITNMVLSSDATVRVSIKSGVTYMTGNASLGIVLNPGGGFIQTGAPDSPSWIGLPSGALVVEKFDMTGTKANIGGTVITYTE